MTLTVVVDFLHLLAAAAWIGGMLFIKLVLMPSLLAADPPQRGRVMGAVAKRFTAVAWSCMAILLITGFLKTPSQFLADTSTSYGTILLVKHAVIALALIVGVLLLFAGPKLNALAPGPGQAPSPAFLAAQGRVNVLSAINTVLGVVVLITVAALRP